MREEIDKALAENKGRGNGVLIDHAAGWQSTQVLLRAGSVATRCLGDAKARVRRQQALSR